MFLIEFLDMSFKTARQNMWGAVKASPLKRKPLKLSTTCRISLFSDIGNEKENNTDEGKCKNVSPNKETDPSSSGQESLKVKFLEVPLKVKADAQRPALYNT